MRPLVKRERLDYYGFMNRLQRVAAGLLISLAVGNQALLAQTTVVPTEADTNSSMNAEMFYQLLLGEIDATS